MLNITTYIPEGKENAVTRGQLCSLTGLPDRSVRECIEVARREGVMVVNNGNGYYIATDIADIKRQYKTDRKRALSVLYRLKAMRKILKDAGEDV